MQILSFEVHAGAVDRVLDREVVRDDVDDVLQHRAAQTERAGAADDEVRAAVTQDDGRAHHRREARACARRLARSNSPIMLLMWMPVLGTTTPEPAPVDAVSATAFPLPSTTEMCVVPRETTAARFLERARETADRAGGDARVRLFAHDAREVVDRFGCSGLAGAEVFEDRQAVGDQQSARRRRWVGEELLAAEARGDGRRRMTRYSSRSRFVMQPPFARMCAAIASARSPS